MIKTSELRRGNIILFSPNKKFARHCVVKTIDEKQICVEDQGESLTLMEDDVTPVTITEETIMELGSVKEILDFRLIRGVCFVDVKGYTLTAMNYIHELQNFVFSITGKEIKSIRIS